MKDIVRRDVSIEVVERSADGGRIIISTGQVDRAKDRVNPLGGIFANYMENPVVQWAHDYYSPGATIGRTVSLETTTTGIVAGFELRPAANDADPQNIVRLLWDGGWIKTASIGFIPTEYVQNELGGLDYNAWELLEWSLVPVPMNPGALALAMKGVLPDVDVMTRGLVAREGRVLSAHNRELIGGAVDAMRAASKALQTLLDESDPEKSIQHNVAATPEPGPTELDLTDAVLEALSGAMTQLKNGGI